ncbi:protein AHNAK2 [Mastomys coucha]|uniref:protein AHNAK2 n=1 Tax=Mastomys coucha TaxID=35658 RepID=UPI0012619634|nr:protein AHNAK2 [Mastomys coucha]
MLKVSGRQLQQQEPEAEPEDDYSVTQRPAGEIIRPRPQGSSPVYEYTAEGAGFGGQENSQGRHSSSGRRRSWWKRDSGESTAFTSMSHPESVQESTEVTLKTDVESGASGYSVTGGGDQGIFVKQVLKDSSAAKLFNLREGDQLLSATIFFDHMKYEDALKILQYSEPYKVQFRIKRKLSTSKGEEGAVQHSQQDLRGQEEQDKDIADGCMETPTKTLEEAGDRERLISKSRDGGHRRTQDRFSWPKFQALRSKQRAGPRRSHSSSEASENRDTRDMSPTSTDTEAGRTADRDEQNRGSGRRRGRFLNLRFGMTSGQSLAITEQKGRELQEKKDEAGVLGECSPEKEDAKGTDVDAKSQKKKMTQPTEFMSRQTRQMTMRANYSNLEKEIPRKMELKTDRHERKKKQAKKLEKHTKLVQHGAEQTPELGWKDSWEEVERLEIGIARLSLKDTSDQNVEVDIQAPGAKLEGNLALADKDMADKDSKFKMPKFKMPSFSVSAPGKPSVEASLVVGVPKVEAEVALPSVQGDQKTPDLSIQLPSADQELKAGQVGMKVPEGQLPEVELQAQAAAGAGLKGHVPKVHMPSLTMPKVDLKGPHVDMKEPNVDVKGPKGKVSAPDVDVSLPGVEVDVQAPGAKLEGDLALADKDVSAKDSKFKMPKFKMPSFSVSVPGKSSVEASLEVGAPNVEAEVAVPSVQGDLKTPDLSIQLPSQDLELKASQVGVKMPEGQLPEVELPEQAAAGAGLKGHLPKVQMPSLKMPKVDLKGPQVDLKVPKLDLKGPKGEVRAPDMDVSLPGVEVDIQAPDAKLEGDLALADKDVSSKDSKFKMPKFKMPSFGVSVPDKPSVEASVEVAAPKVEAEVALPSVQCDLKIPDLSIQLPSADLEHKAGQVGMKLPEGQLPEVELPAHAAAGGSLKGHLPKVQMPSLKMPKVDLKGPKLDVKGPKGEVSALDVDVSLPGVEVDIQVSGAKLEGDLALANKDVATKDSKFKMPKFKMPSFSVSKPSKPRVEASLEVAVPKVEAEVALPSVQGDLKTPDLSIQLPSADLELKAGQVGGKLPEGNMPEVELRAQAAAGAGLKGHLPKVQMPSLKMPKVDLKGPKLDVKGPKGEVSALDVDVSLPGVEVDIQVSSAKLDGDLALADKDVAAKDSTFKMPKFKMPSFGVSTPGKPSVEASLEVDVPKVEAEVALPSVQGDLKTPDLSIQLPSSDMELKAGQEGMKLPEGQLPEVELPAQAAAGGSLKGHLPKVQMPSLKMPKVDLKVPKVDVKGPKGEVSALDVDVSLPGVEVDIQVSGDKLEGDLALANKDMASKDSKFKMPKFKMPSFGVSKPSKPSMEASLEVGAPMVEAEVALPSIQGDLKTPDLSIQLPSADLELKAGQVGIKLPEGNMPEVELPSQAAAGTGLKGHVPKVPLPSLKMPKVDLKCPKLDVKGPKGEVSAPDVDVSLPGVEVDIQSPGAKLDGDLALADKDMAAKDSTFKMPKFKVPSFGVSVPEKPSVEASVEVAAPKVEAEVALPSLQGDLKTPDLSIQLPSRDLELKASQVGGKLPEGNMPEVELPAQAAAGAGLKGHLPKVQMPSLKMPKVDLKGPQVDLKGPKLDLKGPKGKVRAPDVDVSLPGMEVDIQASDAKLEGDLALTDKDMAAKESKFKMPKFKMPSFGVSAPGKPSMEDSIEAGAPKVEAEESLPSVQGDVKIPDLSIQLPSADLELRAGQVGVKVPEGQLPQVELPAQAAAGAGLKGHLAKAPTPSLTMPKVDLKGPQVDLKVPKVDVKGPKGEMSSLDVDVSLPGVEVDIQVSGVKLEGDLALANKDVASKDSKFKMPKFKMPSFGVSKPSKPSMEASLEVGAPMVEAEVALPSMQGDLKTPDLSIQLPSADLELKAGQVGGKLPEGNMPEGEMSSLDVDVSLPGVEVDIQASGAKLDGNLALADKDVAAKDSTFKMPKFKMPSFGMSTHGKPSVEASLEVDVPKVEAEVALTSVQGDLKTPELSIQLPSGDMELKAGQVGMKLPEGQLPEVELPAQAAAGGSLKGHLPKVQMPSLKMPKVDLKGPKVDVKGPKGEVSAPDVDVSLPGVEVDIQVSGAKLEGDLALANKDVTTKDSKFKMPKFKMPSFGVSKSSKPSEEASLEVGAPMVEAEVALPSVQGDLKTPDLSIVGIKLPEGNMPEVELPSQAAAGAGLKGHLPKVQMPSFKMPKVDLKGPQVDLKGPKLDLKGPKGEVRAPDVDVSLPGVEVDIQVSGAKLEGDLALTDKDMAAKDSKFKMPKFKMPSFGVSAPGKPSMEDSIEAGEHKVEMEVSLPSVQGDLKTTDLSIQLPSTDLEVKASQVGVKVPEGQLPEVELPAQAAAGAGLKGYLAKVPMPSLKMPKVDLKGPQVDLKVPKVDVKGPKGEVSALDVDVSLPGVEVDIQAPGAKLEGDLALANKDVTTKDSKFKMPKFKMPSFGVSKPSKPSEEASLEVGAPMVEAEVALPSVQGDLKTPDLSIQLPSADLEFKAGQVGIKLPEGNMPEVELPSQAAAGTGLKGHVPKVPLPSLKMPKVDLKGLHVDLKVPNVDVKGPKGEVSAPVVDVCLPSVEVDIQAPGVPKVDVKGPKGEVSALDVDVSLPGVEVDIQASGAKLDGDLALADMDVAAKDSTFKMPKFKMPSFGMSTPGKPSVEASLVVDVPKVEAEVALTSVQGDLKIPDLSIQLPSADLELKAGQVGMKLPEGNIPEVELPSQAAAATGLKGHLPKVQMPSLKMPKVDLKGPQVDVKGPKLDLKGPKGEVRPQDVDVYLPGVEVDIRAPDAKLEGDLALADKDMSAKESKFKMSKFKMPSFGVSVPGKPSMEYSIEAGAPKVDAEESLPSVHGDLKIPDLSIQLPSADLELKAGQVGVKVPEGQLPEDMAAKDSKFKMPKFKMPSFGVSAPGKPSMEDSIEAGASKVEAEESLPSVQGDLKIPDLSIQLPSADLELRASQVGMRVPEGQLPEVELPAQAAAGAGLKGHLPKVPMPSLKMPKVDLKGPQVDLKVPKVDVKGPKGEVSAPDVDVSFPGVEVDIQVSGAKLEGDLALANRDVATKDSKFKMPKFKMPSFGVSKPTAAGAGLKGHLPKVPMPSLKMPKMDLKGPQVELKVPKVDVKGPKGEVSSLDVDVSLPGLEVDIQASGAKLDGDLALADKDVAAKDSTFKMPKFKMPSFGVSTPGKPSVEASLEVDVPKVEAEVALPSVQGDLKTPDLSIQLPSADLELKAGQVGMKLPEGQLPEVELPAQAVAGGSLKGHLPKVQMPSLKMPKVDLKGSKLDVKGPKGEVSAPDVDVSLPGVEVDIQSPDANLEGDLALAHKDVAAKDSKFKMPKFKMPSFSVSVPGKPSVEASLEVGALKVEEEVSLPSVQVDLKTPDLSIQLPSAELELTAGQVGVKVPEGQLPEVELPTQAAAGAGLKGHLPKVDLKGPHVDLKGPNVDVKGSSVAKSPCYQAVFFQFSDEDTNSGGILTMSHDGSSGADLLNSSGTSQSLLSYVRPSLSMVDSPGGSLDSTLPTFTARIMFPKFHKPKFSLSLPSSEPECDPCVSEAVVPSRGMSHALPASAGPQVLSSDASVCSVSDPSGQSLMSQPTEASNQEAKDSAFTLPGFKLPSFHWSPKKAAERMGDSQGQEASISSLGSSSMEVDSEILSSVSVTESPQHALLDKEVEKGRSRRLSFSMPRLALPKIKALKGPAAEPQGDLWLSVGATTSGGDLVAIETAVSDAHVGDSLSKDVTTELHVRPSSTAAELARSKTELPPPKDDLSVSDDRKSLMIVSASQPFGDLITLRTEGPLKSSSRQRDNASGMETPEIHPTAKETSTDSNERRFKMPKFRVPGFRRSSSKEQDQAGEQEAPQKSLTPVISIPLEAEEAAACVLLSHVPEPKVEAHISLGSPEKGTSVRPPESPTYADVVKRDLHGTGCRTHTSTAELSHTHLSTPKFGAHPSKGSVSLEVPGVRVSEPQLPLEGTSKQRHPGLGVNVLAETEARTGSLPSQPQGPLRLKASITDVPSQVSVVSRSQLWEDSVLTVTFPKLKVPRFSFPAPSSEADVFFPVVREIEASIGSPMHQGTTGLWEASILKTGTEDTRMLPALEQSVEASPVSKVRMHIQGSGGESQEVAMSSRVERVSADPSAPGVFCTQIVRESEIPASTIQTPSYGFSLLKVKIPEPPVQACVYTVAPDSQSQEDAGRAPSPATAGGHSATAEVPPDTGEPFEIISPSAGLPPGPRLADSTSDEEPAEILELPEDSQEVKAPDVDSKQKPEGKKSSLLWSWLPSIGFSSVEEMAAESRDTTQRSPVHVQPTARLDPELPRKQEKAGWFRFPKLGFSSSPTKKPRITAEGEGRTGHRLQEETLTFFDARESFCPEEEEEAKSEVTSSRPGSEAMVASSARTELVLLEQARDTGDKSVPRPAAK